MKNRKLNKKNPAEGDFKEYVLEKFKDPQEAQEYLLQALKRSKDEKNPSIYLLALRNVVEANGGKTRRAKYGLPRGKTRLVPAFPVPFKGQKPLTDKLIRQWKRAGMA